MPCRDPEPYDCPPVNVNQELKNKLDKVTRLLCQLCTTIESYGTSRHYFSGELQQWWKQHQKEDEARIKREKQELKEKRKQYFKLKKELGL